MTVLVPKSSVTGLAWPGLPGASGTKVLALMFQLEQSQWWPPERLLESQFRQLAEVVRHAFETVPFYRQRFEAAGIDPNRELTHEAWTRLPILTRKEVQQSFDALLSRRVPKAHGRSTEITTSGSTGMPVKVLSTALAQFFWRTFTLREHLWYRHELKKTLAAIRLTGGVAAYPQGKRYKAWGSSTHGIYSTGPGLTLDISTKVHLQVEWLERHDPEYLLTFPSNLRALADYCRERAIKLPSLRQALTIGEVLPPETREACREAWGLEVVDTYSAQEVGYMALQCPDGESLHVQAEGVLVEVVDEQRRPCSPGEIGTVVVTPLHNFAMPLIRYEIGDYAEVGEPCPCGRGLPVLRRVMGRVRNIVRLPGGEQQWPAFQRALRTVAQFSQAQIVQHTLEDLEVRLVAKSRLSEADEDKLKELLRELFGYPFRIALTYHDEIPRSASGKFEDFLSELDA